MTEKNLPHTISSVNSLFSFSFHPYKESQAANITILKPVNDIPLDRFITAITNFPWSCSQYKDNYRCIANFIRAHIIALDFDNGKLTIKECGKICRELGINFIIGTTKSHQIEKGGVPPCDRFRLVIPMETFTHSSAMFTQNFIRIMKIFKHADVAVKDAGRFLFPCKKVVDFDMSAVNMKWPISEKEVEEIEKKSKEKRAEKLSFHQSHKIIPNWCMDYLKNGVPEGNRDNTVFKVAAYLFEVGFVESEVESLLLNSNLSSLGENNVKKCISSARRKVIIR